MRRHPTALVSPDVLAILEAHPAARRRRPQDASGLAPARAGIRPEQAVPVPADTERQADVELLSIPYCSAA